MVKPGALLLLLAVAASQANGDPPFTVGSLETRIVCPISFYGHSYSWVQVSFINSGLAVCFKDSQNATALDCLSVDNGVNSDRVRVSAVDEFNGPGSIIVTNLRYSSSTSYCFVKVEFKDGSNLTLIMEIYNFDQLSPLKMSADQDFSPTNFTITTTVNGSVAGNWTFTGKQVSDIVFLETSGCRHLGTPIQANSAVVIPDICTNVLCDTSAVVRPNSTCHGREVCHGNNICAIPKVVCTVTGSTVIDFFNKDYSIPDRCPYTIIKSEQNSSFELLAVFRERRRKDVAFLDHLILTVIPPGVPMFFEQGGRVRVSCHSPSKSKLLCVYRVVSEINGRSSLFDQSLLVITCQELLCVDVFEVKTCGCTCPSEI